MKTDNRIDMFLGPSAVFAGYVFLLVGVVYSFESLAGLILVVAGLFMGFTFYGATFDFERGRIRSYTAIFGLIKLGTWYQAGIFDRFRIYHSRRSYTSYSRANIPLVVKKSDIRLELFKSDRSIKITVNRYDSVEEARMELDQIRRELKLNNLEECRR